MSTDSLIQKIEKCQTLPSLPTVAVQVLQLVRSDEVDIREIAELISNDPALSGKVIRTVNSPFYGLPKTVSTISNAIVILGIEAVKTLVLGFSLVNSMKENGEGDHTQEAYWRRSLYSAVCARMLGKRLNVPEQEELFLAALLHDIGIQIFMQVLGNEYRQLLAEAPAWGKSLARREHERWGMDHSEAGMLLADQWHLPPILSQAIRWHHRPRRAEKRYRRICHVVAMSGLCSEVFMTDRPAHLVNRVHQWAHAAFQIEQGECDDLLNDVSNNVDELARLFEVNLGQTRSYEEILAEANETLQVLTLKSQMQAQQFKTRAETDGLTNVANRRKLEEELAGEFDRAKKFMRPLSVIFMDADHFKKINDTLGHAAGDEALVHLAELVRMFARPMDTVGRYGGEEFALILPEVDFREAIKLAEHIRSAVEQSNPTFAGKCWPMTVSIGVASWDGKGGPYRHGAHLMQAADKAAYAAKSAGRNAVRAFNPKPKSSSAPKAKQK